MSDLADELAAEIAGLGASEAPPADALETLQRLGEEVIHIDQRLENWAKEAKKLGERKNTILQREMVDIMDEKNIPKITVGDRTFTCDQYVHASIPEEFRDQAHDWLEQHEAGDLIKREIIVTFPKDSEEESRELKRYIIERYQMATVEEKRGVPWARLTSWLKELFASDSEDKVLPPLEIMGAKVGRVVKFKDAKVKL